MASPTGGKPKVSISRNKVIDLYIIQDRSGLEAARLLGVSRSTFGRYLERFGIPAKPISEVMRAVRSENPWSTKKILH